MRGPGLPGVGPLFDVTTPGPALICKFEAPSVGDVGTKKGPFHLRRYQKADKDRCGIYV
jgi:hypothetical protein